MVELGPHLHLFSLREVGQEVAPRFSVRDFREVLLVALEEGFVRNFEYFLRVVFELEDVEVRVDLAHAGDRRAGAA